MLKKLIFLILILIFLYIAFQLYITVVQPMIENKLKTGENALPQESRLYHPELPGPGVVRDVSRG
jgi:hypothetical protein